MTVWGSTCIFSKNSVHCSKSSAKMYVRMETARNLSYSIYARFLSGNRGKMLTTFLPIGAVAIEACFLSFSSATAPPYLFGPKQRLRFDRHFNNTPRFFPFNGGLGISIPLQNRYPGKWRRKKRRRWRRRRRMRHVGWCLQHHWNFFYFFLS